MLIFPPTSSKLLLSATRKPNAFKPAGSVPANATELFWALLNHGMISPNLERITNSFTRQFIPHLCNALKL
jgi:hypothetical protein